MKISILTFDGFNEIDSFVAYGILNRMKKRNWKAYITSPTATVTSMNGVIVSAERQLEFANEADAVLIGSGINSLAISKEIGSQYLAAWTVVKLGGIEDARYCIDYVTPVGENTHLVEHSLSVVMPFIENEIRTAL